MVTICATTGASMCYILFENLGKEIVLRKFPSKTKYLREKIDENQDNLFWCMLFLRYF